MFLYFGHVYRQRRPPCEHDDLVGKVDRLQGQVARLTTTIKELRKHVLDCLAAAQRAGKRQAAPFSKGERTSKPRRPGRKPGTGNFSYRKPPAVEDRSDGVPADRAGRKYSRGNAPTAC